MNNIQNALYIVFFLFIYFMVVVLKLARINQPNLNIEQQVLKNLYNEDSCFSYNQEWLLLHAVFKTATIYKSNVILLYFYR